MLQRQTAVIAYFQVGSYFCLYVDGRIYMEDRIKAAVFDIELLFPRDKIAK